MYFFLEAKSGPSYPMSLETLTSHCYDFESEVFMVDFGNSAFLEDLES